MFLSVFCSISGETSDSLKRWKVCSRGDPGRETGKDAATHGTFLAVIAEGHGWSCPGTYAIKLLYLSLMLCQNKLGRLVPTRLYRPFLFTTKPGQNTLLG